MRALLCVIGLSISSAAMAARQPAPPAALAGAMRARVQTARFDTVSTLRGLPLGVRGALQTLFGTQTLDIAEPGAALPATGESADARPPRRLVAAGCSYEDCLVYYERGLDAGRTWRVVLFHWTPNATRFEWGGTAPRGLMTIDDVRGAVLSGAIKGSAGPW